MTKSSRMSADARNCPEGGENGFRPRPKVKSDFSGKGDGYAVTRQTVREVLIRMKPSEMGKTDKSGEMVIKDIGGNLDKWEKISYVRHVDCTSCGPNRDSCELQTVCHKCAESWNIDYDIRAVRKEEIVRVWQIITESGVARRRNVRAARLRHKCREDLTRSVLDGLISFEENETKWAELDEIDRKTGFSSK
jgi:hypothetical protein